MLKLRKFIVGLVVFSLAFSVLGVAAQDEGGEIPDFTVKLGVATVLTGGAASVGQEQLNWVRLAVADFNEATGWNVEIVEGDTELDASKSVLVAEDMIADADIYGVVGMAASQNVAATQELFAEAGLVQVSPSATNPDLTLGGFDTFFRVVPTDSAQGSTLGNFAAEGLGLTSIFIIDDQTTYGTGLAEEIEIAFLEHDGTEVVGRESVTQEDVDFSSLVTNVDRSEAEGVFFLGQLSSQAGVFALQLDEQGVDIQLLGGDGLLGDAEGFLAAAEGAAEGAFSTSFAPDIHNLESSSDVVERFEEEFGDFGTFGPPAYASATVILEAMYRAFQENGELTREAVRDEVANTDQEETVLGIPLAFDENGDVLGAQFYMFQVVDDAFEFFIPEEDED